MVRSAPLKLKITKKSIGLIIIAVMVAGGVAFALLQSQAQLTGNSIQTQSTGLLISQSDSNYSGSTSGYAFAGIIPGVQASQTEHFMLKNTGNSKLALRLSAANVPANPANIDLGKVNIILTPYSTTTFMPGTPQSFTLQALVDANASGGSAIDYPAALTAGAKEEFNIQVSMNSDVVSGSNASLSNIDLVLTGVAAN